MQLRRKHAVKALPREPTTLDFDWDRTRYNRIALINAAAHLIGARSYLEIGCADNATFDSVPLADKVGVDPVSGGTHRMTSDQYFEDHNRKFDLIFIDGLHTYAQAEHDLSNAVDRLPRDGVIVMHDCLPVSWIEQAVPRLQNLWTGDVWKAAFEAKARADLDLRVVSIDHGCAIIIKRANTDLVDFAVEDYDALDFEFYRDHHPRLGILSFQEAIEFLERPPAG